LKIQNEVLKQDEKSLLRGCFLEGLIFIIFPFFEFDFNYFYFVSQPILLVVFQWCSSYVGLRG